MSRADRRHGEPCIEISVTHRIEDTEKTIWLKRKEAAHHMRLSPATLENWASLDCGPEYVRLGRGRVLYRRDDIDNWMQHQANKVA
jgi:predicted DNA-binding transcriptional regulator AlpA